MMDYKKKYKNALVMAEEIIRYYKEHNRGDEAAIEDLKGIFPELKESEDERIRKGLIFYLGDMPEDTELRNGITNRDVLAWLEKQKSVGEIVERCKNSWYNEGKIAGMSEGLTDDEKYQQGWHDALEKQGEQKHTDRVEPKFKVGDIVKFDRPSAMLKREILSIDFENERYLTRRTDIGGAIKEFIYFCEQDDYVIVGSHNNNPSLEDKVSILADEIIALKQRVKALEIQVIKDMSTPPLTQVYSCPDKAGDNVTLEDMKG